MVGTAEESVLTSFPPPADGDKLLLSFRRTTHRRSSSSLVRPTSPVRPSHLLHRPPQPSLSTFPPPSPTSPPLPGSTSPPLVPSPPTAPSFPSHPPPRFSSVVTQLATPTLPYKLETTALGPSPSPPPLPPPSSRHGRTSRQHSGRYSLNVENSPTPPPRRTGLSPERGFTAASERTGLAPPIRTCGSFSFR